MTGSNSTAGRGRVGTSLPAPQNRECAVEIVGSGLSCLHSNPPSSPASQQLTSVSSSLREDESSARLAGGGQVRKHGECWRIVCCTTALHEPHHPSCQYLTPGPSSRPLRQDAGTHLTAFRVPPDSYHNLHPCARPVVTKLHMLGGFHNRHLRSHSSKDWKSRVKGPVRGREGESVPGLTRSGWLVAGGLWCSWLADTSR